jgi:short-subunit dehydrogenase
MNYYTLITGASTGIGKELAKTFAKNQYNLLLVARSKDKLENLKKELESQYSIHIEILSVDLSKLESPKIIYDFLKQKNLPIQILINNAGFATNGFFLKNSIEEEKNEILVNITSLLELTYLIGNEMIKDSHEKPKFFYKILNVASTAAFQPGPFMSSYYASKAFVLHFSEGLYEELKDKNILVSTLCPGATKTEFFKRAKMENSKLVQSPLIMSAEDVAKYTFRKLMKNKVIIIPGIMNKIGVFSIRLFPRNIVRKITKYLNQSN